MLLRHGTVFTHNFFRITQLFDETVYIYGLIKPFYSRKQLIAHKIHFINGNNPSNMVK